MKSYSAILSKIWLISWLIFSPICLIVWPKSRDYNLPRALGGPGLSHPLGFDAFGRDLLQISVRGGLNSLVFAALVVAAAIILAVFFAGVVITLPGCLKTISLRVIDFSLAFPSLLIALAFAAIRGPGWSTLWFSLLVGILPMLVRLIYARAQDLLVQEFIQASRSLGARKYWIFIRHILPSLVSIAVLKAPLLFVHVIMAEATLSFLGLGAPIGNDTWGSLLAQGKDYLIEAPHLAIGIGIPLILTTFSLQKISDLLESTPQIG